MSRPDLAVSASMAAASRISAAVRSSPRAILATPGQSLSNRPAGGTGPGRAGLVGPRLRAVFAVWAGRAGTGAIHDCLEQPFHGTAGVEDEVPGVLDLVDRVGIAEAAGLLVGHIQPETEAGGVNGRYCSPTPATVPREPSWSTRPQPQRVRPRVEWPGAEVDDSLVQLTGHHAHLRLESRVMPRVSTNFPIRRVETLSRLLVATTLTRARSARLRRSSSHSGK